MAGGVRKRRRETALRLVVVGLALSLACLSGPWRSTAAQETLVRPKMRTRVKGKRVVVYERGRARTLDLTGKVDAAVIEEAEVLFLSRKGEAVYLLIDVCGLSKMPPDDRMCGAGTECNVVWLRLDRRWRIADAQEQRYESCWLPVTSDEGPRLEGRRLLLELDDLREELRHEVAYDADEPEKGLTRKSRPIPKATP